MGNAGTYLAAGGAGLTAAGSYSGNPWLIGGGMLASTIGGLLGGGGSTTTKVSDPTTPYRVKLPSGAVITMYAHGKGSTTTSTDPNIAGAIAAGTNTYGTLAMKKYEEEQAKIKAKEDAAAAVNNATGTLVDGPVSPDIPPPVDFYA
jgi:hypothetical protein